MYEIPLRDLGFQNCVAYLAYQLFCNVFGCHKINWVKCCSWHYTKGHIGLGFFILMRLANLSKELLVISLISQDKTYIIRSLPALSVYVLLEGDKKYFNLVLKYARNNIILLSRHSVLQVARKFSSFLQGSCFLRAENLDL